VKSRLLIALLLALGMTASSAFAQGTYLAAAQPTQPAEPADPVDEEEAEAEAPVVFPIEDVWATLTRNPELVDFYSAMQAAHVNLVFDAEQEFTVFAPTSEAFAEAFDAQRTQDALSYYVVRGSYSWQDLWEMAEAGDGSATLTTINDLDMTVEIIEGELFVNGMVQITQPDIPAQNGFVHVIDGLIQPAGTIGG
jgi:transforming growth factor-beta-induced protein